jgi:hypothetical protein
MGDIRNANPEHLDELADKLWTHADGGVYGDLSAALGRARDLDASAEVASLRPLLDWLRDAAIQLHEGARILRQDGDGPFYDPNVGDHPRLPGDAESGPGNGERWEFEVSNQFFADEFAELASKDELSEEDIGQLQAWIEESGKDPDFAAYLVDTVGVEEFLLLSQRVEEVAADADGEAQEDAAAMRTSMGNILNAAFWVPGNLFPGTDEYQSWLENTPQGQAYAERLDAFNNAGQRQMGSEDDPRLGYDVAFDLMGQAEVPVDDQFFTETMAHLNAPYAPGGGDVCVAWPEEMSQSLLLACARTNPDATRAYLLPRPTHPELEAAWAADLVAKGEDMTELERATLAAVLQSNEDDSAFNQALLDDIGTNDLMEFSALIAEGAHGDDGRAIRQDYARLQEGLANGIAAATRETDTQWYRDFMSSLDTFGKEQYDVDFSDQDVRGYQLLTTTLDTGGGYSNTFLTDLADNIRAAEDPDQGGDENIWQEERELNDDGIDQEEREWFALDPMDGTLGIMSRDPDTATAYLNPGPDEGNDTLNYLINERNWAFLELDAPAEAEALVDSGGPEELQSARTGLGLALEAATTGHMPGEISEHGYHTASQARVMHTAIELFDQDGDADELLASDAYANVRGPFINALAEYSADTFDIYCGEGEGLRGGEDHSFRQGDGSGRLGNGRDSLIRVMRGLSTSEENYAILYEAQQVYMAERLADLEHVDDTNDAVGAWDNEARRIGEVYGVMNGIGADMVLDDRDALKAFNTDVRTTGPAFGQAVVSRIPIVGADVGKILDLGTYQWWKSANADADDYARDELAQVNDTSQDQLTALIIDGFGGDRGIQDSVAIDSAEGEAQQSYASGRDAAFTALRPLN